MNSSNKRIVPHLNNRNWGGALKSYLGVSHISLTLFAIYILFIKIMGILSLSFCYGLYFKIMKVWEWKWHISTNGSGFLSKIKKQKRDSLLYFCPIILAWEAFMTIKEVFLSWLTYTYIVISRSQIKLYQQITRILDHSVFLRWKGFG